MRNPAKSFPQVEIYYVIIFVVCRFFSFILHTLLQQQGKWVRQYLPWMNLWCKNLIRFCLSRRSRVYLVIMESSCFPTTDRRQITWHCRFISFLKYRYNISPFQDDGTSPESRDFINILTKAFAIVSLVSFRTRGKSVMWIRLLCFLQLFLSNYIDFTQFCIIP